MLLENELYNLMFFRFNLSCIDKEDGKIINNQIVIFNEWSTMCHLLGNVQYVGQSLSQRRIKIFNIIQLNVGLLTPNSLLFLLQPCYRYCYYALRSLGMYIWHMVLSVMDWYDMSEFFMWTVDPCSCPWALDTRR